ncbi:MAG: DUF1080 domain-containing protein, partial [Gemmataceae bacterium]|nr:DUF1080 domain-containing protein [Gemmataceae bacterium]
MSAMVAMMALLAGPEFESLLSDDLKGWKHAGNWKMEDGVLTRSGKGGGLTYDAKKVPDDFELRFSWKVGAGSNSGVYYRPGQYEYQILDNKKHGDGKNPRTSAASLYFCMPPSKDATKPVGEWNEGRIVCKGTVIQHWLNGEKVIDFDYADKKWAWEVELLKRRGGDVKARSEAAPSGPRRPGVVQGHQVAGHPGGREARALRRGADGSPRGDPQGREEVLRRPRAEEEVIGRAARPQVKGTRPPA